jgi:predicted transposase YdaD
MTTYNRLMEKWKTEGELIGIQKERTEGKAKVILNLFDEGFETPRIAKIVEMREQEVVTILKNKGRLK